MNLLRTTLLVGLSLADENPTKLTDNDVTWEHTKDNTKTLYRPSSDKPVVLEGTVCQEFLGYQFFDFKNLDFHMRDSHGAKPSII